jgi:hypothetical protein
VGVIVVTTSERLRVIRDSLDRLTDTFQRQADAGVGIPHDLLIDAVAALESIREFAQVTEETALDVETRGPVPEPQSLHYLHHHLRRVK